MESDAIGTAAANADISVLGLIADADPVVKLVMFFLFLAFLVISLIVGVLRRA